MDRAYEANVEGVTTPAFPTAHGFPRDSTPSTPGTVPGAGWFHMITEEIRNAIVASGGTPDTTDVTQLTAAIKALAAIAFTDALHSIGTTSGYFTIPGINVMVQYLNHANSSPSETVAFPHPFPNACFGVVATPNQLSGSSTKNAQTGGWTTSSFTLYADTNETPTFCIAIGN